MTKIINNNTFAFSISGNEFVARVNKEHMVSGSWRHDYYIYEVVDGSTELATIADFIKRDQPELDIITLIMKEAASYLMDKQEM